MGNRIKCWVLILAIVMTILAPVSVLADDVVYQGTLRRLDVATRLFTMENMIPGDSQSRNVILRNSSSASLTFYLKAEPEAGQEQIPLQLLQNMNLRVAYYGVAANGQVDATPSWQYNGPATGSGGSQALSSYVTLGQVAAQRQAVLTITLTMPTSLGNTYQNKLAATNWSFYCSVTEPGGNTENSRGNTGNSGWNTGNPGGLTTIEDTNPPLGTIEILDGEIPTAINPYTGGGLDENEQRILLLVALVSGILVIVLFPKRKKKPTEETSPI